MISFQSQQVAATTHFALRAYLYDVLHAGHFACVVAVFHMLTQHALHIAYSQHSFGFKNLSSVDISLQTLHSYKTKLSTNKFITLTVLLIVSSFSINNRQFDINSFTYICIEFIILKQHAKEFLISFNASRNCFKYG